MRRRLIATLFLSMTTLTAAAQEYRVEPIAEPAPSDGVAPAIHARLAPHGLRVVKGEKRTVYEIWLCKDWPVDGKIKLSSERLYPFQRGELIGLARLRRRGSDFRDQDISRGLYTLRYALQPIDGNHEGTSPTRDFLLLVRAQDDSSPERMEISALLSASAEAAAATHPAMLCLQKIDDDTTSPQLRHQPNNDWWVLRAAGKSAADDSAVPVDLVVVGHAIE